MQYRASMSWVCMYFIPDRLCVEPVCKVSEGGGISIGAVLSRDTGGTLYLFDNILLTSQTKTYGVFKPMATMCWYSTVSLCNMCKWLGHVYRYYWGKRAILETTSDINDRSSCLFPFSAVVYSPILSTKHGLLTKHIAAIVLVDLLPSDCKVVSRASCRSVFTLYCSEFDACPCLPPM